MRGQVVHIASDDSDGFIRGDDGNRYPFAVADWLATEPAIVGSSADFELTDGRATMVCAIPANAGSSLSGFAATLARHKGLLIGLAAFALLLVALNAAMVRGMFSGVIGDEHGPVKSYLVTGPAKVRNMPTTQGSTVLSQLNPGDSFSGQIYLGPDGKSQWIKKEGAEEYVSIVNLAEDMTTHQNPAQPPEQQSVLANGCDKIIGIWRVNFSDGGEEILRIQKSNDVYLLVSNRNTHSRTQDSFSGNCQSGIINTNSVVGNASYIDSDDRVVFHGNQFSRSSEDGESKIVSDRQAAAEAARQVQLAQDRDRTLMAGMQLAAYNCHDHWKNNCKKTLQDHDAHPELAEQVWAHNRVTLAQAKHDAEYGQEERR